MRLVWASLSFVNIKLEPAVKDKQVHWGGELSLYIYVCTCVYIYKFKLNIYIYNPSASLIYHIEIFFFFFRKTLKKKNAKRARIHVISQCRIMES